VLNRVPKKGAIDRDCGAIAIYAARIDRQTEGGGADRGLTRVVQIWSVFLISRVDSQVVIKSQFARQKKN
jgi:hypothetical protein